MFELPEDLISLENVLAFTLCEGIGVPFCYAAAQEILDQKYISGIVGFVVGIPLLVLGVSWPWLKSRLKPRALALMNQLASPNRILFLLGCLFVYVAGPTLAHRFRVAWQVPVTIGRTAQITAKPDIEASVVVQPPDLVAQGLDFPQRFLAMMQHDFLSLPRPCEMRIVAPPQLQQARGNLLSAAINSQIRGVDGVSVIPPCSILNQDEDAQPELYGHHDFPAVGIAIHTSEKNIPVRKFLASLFLNQGGGSPVTGDSVLPSGSPDDLIYIELGKRLHE